MEIHREILIEHVKNAYSDYHVHMVRYELHKSRDSIMCYTQMCKKNEYVFDANVVRIMYDDYNRTLRKSKIKSLLK